MKASLRESIRSIIDTYREQGIDTLPGTRLLARQLGVSYVTVAKVLKSLAEEGLVIISDRRSARIAGSPLDGADGDVCGDAPEPARSSRQAVRREIERDILTGVFATGSTLPTLKECAFRYGVSSRTASRALVSLEHDGLLERTGRRFRVPSRAESMRTRGTILLVSGPLPERPGWSMFDGPPYNELVRELERRSHASGCRFAKAIYPRYEKRASRFVTEDGRPIAAPIDRGKGDQPSNQLMRFEGGVIGIVLLPLGSPGWQREAIRTARRYRCPTALFRSGHQRHSAPTAENTPVRAFQTSPEHHAGRTVAEYLLRAGHRYCAFIAPFGSAPWAIERLDGFREAFRRSGVSFEVVTIADERATDLSSLMQHRYRWTPQRVERFLDTSHVNRFESKARCSFAVRERLWRAMQQEALEAHIRPLLQRTLTHGRLTAWVAANDAAAIAALGFLERKRIAVPRDISVIGFDNGYDAFRWNLSSYSFNVAAHAHAMIEYLLEPRGRYHAYAEPVFPIPGVLVERGSSGPAGFDRSQ